jgi:glutaminase
MTATTTTHIQETLRNVYEKYKDVRDGEVAGYIPELAKAKPETSTGIKGYRRKSLLCP